MRWPHQGHRRYPRDQRGLSREDSFDRRIRRLRRDHARKDACSTSPRSTTSGFETMEETGLKEGDEIDVKLIGLDPKTNKAQTFAEGPAAETRRLCRAGASTVNDAIGSVVKRLQRAA